MSVHKTILIILYATGFLFALMVAAKGLGYYVLPIGQRPFSGLHRTLKPGGLWGHGLGILGSSMLLLLFLYSARKRNVLGLRFGKMSYWLNIHIFLGIMGPVFVTLHTAFKFGGIVSVKRSYPLFSPCFITGTLRTSRLLMSCSSSCSCTWL